MANGAAAGSGEATVGKSVGERDSKLPMSDNRLTVQAYNMHCPLEVNLTTAVTMAMPMSRQWQWSSPTGTLSVASFSADARGLPSSLNKLLPDALPPHPARRPLPAQH